MPISVHEERLAQFIDKCPRYGLAAPFWEPTPPPPDPPLQFSPPSVDLLYVYGIGEGSAVQALAPWLSQNPRRKLVFLEKREGVIAAFLSSPFAPPFLSSPQMELHHVPRLTPSFAQTMAALYPAPTLDCLCHPREERRAFLRLQQALLTASSYSVSLQTDQIHAPHLFRQMREAARHLSRSFYASSFYGQFHNVPAILCGAGPSLDALAPQLRLLRDRALILSAGSALSALLHRCIAPHFAFAVDPNQEEEERFKPLAPIPVPLLYSLRLYPGVFSHFSGPIGYCRSGVGGLFELWIDEQLGLTERPLFAKADARSLSALPLLATFAAEMGCNPILFAGVDMCYKRDLRYAAGVPVFHTATEQQQLKDPVNQVVSRGPFTTAVRWLIEAKALSSLPRVWKQTQFYNVTPDGLPISTIPFRPLDSFSFASPRPLDAQIEQLIAAHPMPPHTLDALLEPLSSSLKRSWAHLAILAKEAPGSPHLAELELQEELAYLLLLRSYPSLFAEGAVDWKRVLEWARAFGIT